MITRRIAILGVAALALAGCKDEGQATPTGQGGGDQAKGDAFHVATLERLRQQGLSIGNFEAAEATPYGAARCARGKIADLDVLLCAFADAAAAGAAEGKLLGFAKGALTAAARTRGELALVAADRAKNDLKGERLNRLVSSFVGDAKPKAPAAKVPPAKGS